MKPWNKLWEWLAEPNDRPRQQRRAHSGPRQGFDLASWLRDLFGNQKPQRRPHANRTDRWSFLDHWWDWVVGEPGRRKRKLPYTVRSRRYHPPADPLRRAIDWITMRSVHTFYVKQGRGWTGASIERMLREHGIKIGFHAVLHGEIFFEVPAQQAGLVELLLLKAGVPLMHVDPGPTAIPEDSQSSDSPQ
jgi:hypothetical protein